MTNKLLEEVKKRLRAYDEAKNAYEKDDARVAIEGQAHGDIEELVAEVERLREALRVAAAGVCFARSACACATCAARNALKEVAP